METLPIHYPLGEPTFEDYIDDVMIYEIEDFEYFDYYDRESLH